MTWHAFAACRGLDPEIFFPTRGDSDGVERAKAVCADCLVRSECLSENVYEREGIYGGTSGRQRRDMNKAEIAPLWPCIECGQRFRRTNANHQVCSSDCNLARRRQQKNDSHARTKS